MKKLYSFLMTYFVSRTPWYIGSKFLRIKTASDTQSDYDSEAGRAFDFKSLLKDGAAVSVVAADSLSVTFSSSLVSFSSANASTLAELAARHCLSVWQDSTAYPHFSAWGYEGGVIQLGLWEISALLDPATASHIQQQCSDVLESFMAPPRGLAYEILHDDRILFPWGYSIGDHIALYPVAYAARVRYYSNATYVNQSDIALCNAVAKRFVLGFPHRLLDGTVSRSVGWGTDYFPANSSAVWVDDSFMENSKFTSHRDKTGFSPCG